MHGKYGWKSGLAVLGAYAACTVAMKLLRVLYLWAELALGPVRVERFKGEWALVTGGSEGVGKAVAAVLAKQGMHIILVSRSQAKLDAAAADIRQSHPKTQLRTIATDLTAPDSCKTLLQQLSDTPITVLVANVGGGVCEPKEYWTYTDQDEAYIKDLNGTACYSLVKGLLPGMVERNKGAVVAVSSVMHHWGAYAAPYGAEKAKMNALMAALDSELQLAGSSVTAQAMVLGPINTPGVARLKQAHQQPAVSSADYRQGGDSGSQGTPASSAAAAAAATVKAPANGKTFIPSIAAADVADAMVRSIGKGGPVVTPYWRHALMEQVLLGNCWWPPELQRGVKRSMSRKFKSIWEGKQ